MSCNVECAKELVKAGINLEITAESTFSKTDIKNIVAAASEYVDAGHITVEASKFTRDDLIGFANSITRRLTVRF